MSQTRLHSSFARVQSTLLSSLVPEQSPRLTTKIGMDDGSFLQSRIFKIDTLNCQNEVGYLQRSAECLGLRPVNTSDWEVCSLLSYLPDERLDVSGYRQLWLGHRF